MNLSTVSLAGDKLYTTQSPLFDNTSIISDIDEADGNSSPAKITVITLIETTLLGILALVGLTGNVLIMKTFWKAETKFARQIMTLFCSLAVGDALICLLRIPILMHSSLYGTSHGYITCVPWQMTSATLGTVMWKNFLVGFQRIFIMYDFQCYRKYFTFQSTIIMIIVTWILQWTVQIGLSKVLLIQFTYQNELICKRVFLTFQDKILLRSITIGLLGISPLFLTACCHTWIVYSIIKSGLTRMDNVDDRSSYHRIIVTAGMRTTLLLCCWGPYLFLNMADPEYISFDSSVRKYLDYLLCFQSVFSPYISLGDSDLKDSHSRKKSNMTSLRTAGIQSSVPQSHRYAGSSMTSGELKTNRATE